MRFPAQSQANLTKRTSMRRADLFVLTTYLDRDSQAVDTFYYWSDASRRYDYNRTGSPTYFEPVIRTRSGPDAQNMTHVQDFGGGHAQTVEIVCANRPIDVGSKYLIEQLREGTLFRATIEVAELLIRADQDEADLTNLPGDEHVVVFRGELFGPVKISEDTFTLQFQSIEPKVPWKYANGPTVDLDDVGKRLPVVYGRMPRVECVGLDVGGESTLSTALGVGANEEVFVSDISRFQNSGIVYVEGERITYSSTNTTLGKLTGTNRVSPKEHAAGSRVLEIRASMFAVAGHVVAAINDLYVRRSDGEIVKVTTATTKAVSESVGDYGAIATARLSSAQFESLVQSLEEETPAEITQQPSVSQQTTITTLRVAEIGQGTLEPITGWEMHSMTGYPARTGYAYQRAVLLAPTPEDLLGITNSASYWDITISGGPNGDEPIVSPSATNDMEFFIACGAGEGVLNFGFAERRYTTGERDSGAGVKAYGVLVGPFTVPAGGTLDAFVVTVEFSDVPLTAPDDAPPDADDNRMSIAAVASVVGAQSAYFTNAPPTSWALYAGIASTSLQEVVTVTDIEIANDDGSIVKGTAKNRHGASRLKLYADVDGFVLSGITPIEEAPAILQHFITNFCGQVNAGDQSYDVSLTNSNLNSGGFRKHAMDVRSLGTGFAQILARMSWEMRSNMVRLEGQVVPHGTVGDVFAIDLSGTDEWLASTSTQAIGITNAWSITFSLLSTGWPPAEEKGLVIIEPAAGDVNAIRITATTGGDLRVRLWDSAGTLFKEYTFDGSGLDFASGLHLYAVVWNGTTLQAFLDGGELTALTTPTDAAGTMTATARRVSLGAFFAGTGPFEGYFFHAAAWSTAITTELEQGAVSGMFFATPPIGGPSLRVNLGDYASAGSLVHWFRPGFPAAGSYAGGTYLSDEVASGSISVTAGASNLSDADLVFAPETYSAAPGSTYYGLRCASHVGERFRLGFPFTTDLPEDQAGVGVLDQFTSAAEVGRDPETIKTRLRVLYGWDASRGHPSDPNALRYALQAGPIGNGITYPSTGDFVTAERRFGRRDEDTMVFLTIQDASTAADTLAYLAHASLLDTRTWEFGGVPWEIAYQLEPGDVIVIPATPWAPNDAWLARVLGIARDNDSGLASLTVLGVARRDAFLGAGTITPTGAGTMAHGQSMTGAGVVARTGAGVIHFRASMVGAGDETVTGTGAVRAVVRAGGSGAIGEFISGDGVVFFTI